MYVRDQILATFAAARASTVPAARLADAKSHDRYAFARTLDSTERIAAVVARYASYRRSYDTSTTTTARSIRSRRRTFRPRRASTSPTPGLIVTTLSKDPLPAGIERAPSLGAFETGRRRR